jgi:hypothetical protein
MEKGITITHPWIFSFKYRYLKLSSNIFKVKAKFFLRISLIYAKFRFLWLSSPPLHVDQALQCGWNATRRAPGQAIIFEIKLKIIKKKINL